MVEQPPEQPLYLLPQNKKRVMIPKIASLIVLGVLFYTGILLNLSLLQLDAEQQSVVNLASIVLLGMILALGIYLGYHQVGQPYRFYQNRIMLHKKAIFYNQVSQIVRVQSFVDKMFKTYHLDLGNKLKIENIPEEVQIEAYLQQWVNYARSRPV